MDLLIGEGKLPNFARLRREGAYELLQSSIPMLSPILWNTIATGKTPRGAKIVGPTGEGTGFIALGLRPPLVRRPGLTLRS